MHDPTNERYGRLTILGYSGRKYKNGDKFVTVRCDCGVEKEMTYPAVKRDGGNRSCGCQRWQGTHNMSGTPLYRAWLSMHSRCYNKRDVGYPDYGGRGIKVVRRWHAFEAFQADMSEGFAPRLVLDRMHNDKDYMRSNCRWLTRAESNRNMRSNLAFLVEGRTLCFAELVREYGGARYRLALWRYREAGWEVSRAINLRDPAITIKEMQK